MDKLNEQEMDELTRILLNTEEQCQMVDQMIKKQIDVKDQMIDKLHKELEYYKQESADRFIEQVMKAIIKVRKDMKRQIYSEQWEGMSKEDIKREYIYIYEDLLDLLEQQNIDVYETREGDMFDAAIHQAKTELTNEIENDKKIKQSVEDGYKKGEKILIPEKVVVYKYKEKGEN